jgi:hypothetical protein
MDIGLVIYLETACDLATILDVVLEAVYDLVDDLASLLFFAFLVYPLEHTFLACAKELARWTKHKIV